MARKKEALGMGLDSLLSSGIDSVGADDRLTALPVALITPGRYQPRTQINDDALQELAESIRAQGVIQPVIVRESGLEGYELIAGERRWRAAQLAGLEEIPAVVKSISDENALAIGLIENIQRQNLNPIEEARGLKRLVDEFGLTHERVAESVGRSRSSITNSLRLLTLPEAVQDLLFARALEMGHARALVALPVIEQIDLAQKAAKNGWSVREVERRARPKAPAPPKAVSAGRETAHLEQRLAELTGTAVRLQCSPKGKGRLTFAFSSLEELDGLLRRIGYQE